MGIEVFNILKVDPEQSYETECIYYYNNTSLDNIDRMHIINAARGTSFSYNDNITIRASVLTWLYSTKIVTGTIHIYIKNETDSYYSVLIVLYLPDGGMYKYIIRFDCAYYSLEESLRYIVNNVVDMIQSKYKLYNI